MKDILMFHLSRPHGDHTQLQDTGRRTHLDAGLQTTFSWREAGEKRRKKALGRGDRVAVGERGDGRQKKRRERGGRQQSTVNVEQTSAHWAEPSCHLLKGS